MTAPTVLPSLDLTKYEGHTPGPWLLANTSNGDPWLVHTDSTVTYTDTEGEDCFAICWFATGDPEIFKANAHLITDAPQLLAALLTMQRERDEALRRWSDSESNLAACDSDLQTMQERLAASERTCAELRKKVDDLRIISNVNGDWNIKYSQAINRAEAAERTVEGLRADASTPCDLKLPANLRELAERSLHNPIMGKAPHAALTAAAEVLEVAYREVTRLRATASAAPAPATPESPS